MANEQEDTTEIDLKLTVTEVNTILASLGKHPFEEISNLINKIIAQGRSQLAETQVNGDTND